LDRILTAQEEDHLMEDKAVHEVVVVSGACCMPHLAKADKAVERTLDQVIGETGLAILVRKVGLSELLTGGGDLPAPQRQQVLALFQRYGAGFTPAVMIDGRVRFAGIQPTVSQLKEALQKEPTSA
jgi:hypothetical protein